MKKDKVIYWTATAIVVLLVGLPGFAYLFSPDIKAGFVKLGFPDFFRVELGVAKILGAILLLSPVPGRVKEWVYAGYGITLISAVVAHLSTGDGPATIVMPLFVFGALTVSYLYHHKLHRPKYAAA